MVILDYSRDTEDVMKPSSDDMHETMLVMTHVYMNTTSMYPYSHVTNIASFIIYGQTYMVKHIWSDIYGQTYMVNHI